MSLIGKALGNRAGDIKDSLLGNRDESGVRVLKSISNAEVGDFFKVGFCPVSELSDKSFQVMAIDSYEFGESHRDEVVFTVSTDEGECYRLRVLSEHGGEKLVFFKSANYAIFDDLLNLEKFGRMFEGDNDKFIKIKVKGIPESVVGWTPKIGEKYLQEVGLKSYCHKDVDHRKIDLSYKDGRGCDFYELFDAEQKFGLRVEVYDDCVDEYVLAVLPVHHIEELWAASPGGD